MKPLPQSRKWIYPSCPKVSLCHFFFFFLIQAAVKKVQSYYWQPCEFLHVFLTWTSLLLRRQPGHPHFRQVTILMSKLVWPPVGIDHSQKPESWAQWILLPQPPKSNYDSPPQMILYSVTGIIIRQNIENIKLQCQSKIPEAFYDRCHYHLPEILMFSVICYPFLIIPRLAVLLKVLPEVDWFSLHLSLCTSAGHCCWCSDTQACPTLCIPMNCSVPASLSFTISWSFLKLMSIELMMASNHLILCHPLLLLPSTFPIIRVSFNWLALHIRWSKYWSFCWA